MGIEWDIGRIGTLIILKQILDGAEYQVIELSEKTYSNIKTVILIGTWYRLKANIYTDKYHYFVKWNRCCSKIDFTAS